MDIAHSIHPGVDHSSLWRRLPSWMPVCSTKTSRCHMCAGILQQHVRGWGPGPQSLWEQTLPVHHPRPPTSRDLGVCLCHTHKSDLSGRRTHAPPTHPTLIEHQIYARPLQETPISPSWDPGRKQTTGQRHGGRHGGGESQSRMEAGGPLPPPPTASKGDATSSCLGQRRRTVV